MCVFAPLLAVMVVDHSRRLLRAAAITTALPCPEASSPHRLPCCRVLHQELAAAKASMAEYVASLQAQQVQQAQQAGQPAGGAPPAVRVN